MLYIKHTKKYVIVDFKQKKDDSPLLSQLNSRKQRAYLQKR